MWSQVPGWPPVLSRSIYLLIGIFFWTLPHVEPGPRMAARPVELLGVCSKRILFSLKIKYYKTCQFGDGKKI